MGWIYFLDTGEFLGELPEGTERQKRKAMIEQIEKSQPGTFENFTRAENEPE